MKFLVIGRQGPNQIPLEYGEQLFRANAEYMKGMLESGKADCYYWFADTMAGCSIANAESAAELIESIAKYPISGLLEWEVYPLVDGLESELLFAEIMAERAKQLAGG